jgi:transcriptional/translational regulatory protein YebC/TACO1
MGRKFEVRKLSMAKTQGAKIKVYSAKGGGGEDYSTARYEGFGPGNCMVIVDCLTDNNNRTFMDVRQAFVKNNAKIGSPGTVGHMFEHQAVFEFKGTDEEVVLENLMMEDVDVTDITCEDGEITVYAPHTEFFKVKNALAATMADVEIDSEEIAFVPQTMTELAGDDIAMFEKFLDALNDCDDVQNVYHNAEIAD